MAGSGVAGAVDFTAVADFALTIAAASQTGTASFTVTPENDAIDESDETLTVSGTVSTVPDLAVTAATLTLTDDDGPPTGVTLAVQPGSVAEDGGAATVEVTATVAGSARAEPTEVTLTVAGSGVAGAVDFAAVADFALTIAAASQTGTASFTVTPENDAIDESDETLTVSGTVSTLPDLAVTAATLTLTDDDGPPTRVTLTVSGTVSTLPDLAVTAADFALTLTLTDDDDVRPTGVTLTLNPCSRTSVAEDGGAATVEVTATVAGSARAEPTEVTLTVAGSGAAGAVDFTAVADFALTIAAASQTGTASFTVTPENDAIDESDETLTVSGTVSTGPDLAVTAATLTLTDDDVASTGIALTLNPASVSEGAGGTAVTVTAALDESARTGDTEVTVSVAGTTATEGTDFAAVTGVALTIAAGAPSGEATFTLTPTQDEIAEGDETLTVSGTVSTVPDLAVTAATLTLTDDDGPPTGVTLAVQPGSVAEDGGAATVEVTATVAGSARAEPTEVTLTVAGSGVAGAVDFTAVADFALTIAAASQTGTASFTVTPENDAIDESDETLTVSGTVSTGRTWR